MSVAEKLTTIAENQQRVYDAGYAKGQAEGGGGSYDEGYEDGKQDGINSVRETIVITQDCTNVLQCYNLLVASNSPDDKLVAFINKAWTGLPNSSTKQNQLLYMFYVSEEFASSALKIFWIRWRDNKYSAYNGGADYINSSFDANLSVGEEWERVVLL